MDSFETECVVIGAGVVGLAVARRLALAGREVVILERNGAIGEETSSRNSEVIHAGIYYPRGSLKARTCVDGRDRLYRYCAEHGVPHSRLGKLIVATDAAEAARLPAIAATAAGNGVDDLRALTGAEARALEPALNASGALLSPSTGIIDSHALMLSYLGEAETHGAVLARHAPVTGGAVEDGIHRLQVGGASPAEIACRVLINAAGLDAPAIAATLDGFPKGRVPRQWLAKGRYFALAGPCPFRRLIYPLPAPGGLGVHLGLDLAGQAKFGPDVVWVEKRDYEVPESDAVPFYGAVRRYWPDLPDDVLRPGYAGIRPKLAGPGAPAADFLVQGPAEHGIAGLVNLFGIESPGLTASLSLADAVAETLSI